MFKRFNSSVWLCIQFGMSLIVPHVTYIQSELAENENFDLYQLDVKTIRKNQKISQIEENLDSLSKPSLLQQADMLDPHDHIPSDIEVGSTLPSLLVKRAIKSYHREGVIAPSTIMLHKLRAPCRVVKGFYCVASISKAIGLEDYDFFHSKSAVVCTTDPIATLDLVLILPSSNTSYACLNPLNGWSIDISNSTKTSTDIPHYKARGRGRLEFTNQRTMSAKLWIQPQCDSVSIVFSAFVMCIESMFFRYS
ncbi:hypothetical protein ABKN59_009158 [Abortiporus biennis]